MVAVIPRSALLSHKKALRAAKPTDKKVAAKAMVSLRISDALLVETLGFSERIGCEPIERGSAIVPYPTWYHVVNNIDGLVESRDVRIEIQDNRFRCGAIEIKNPKIKLVKTDKYVFDIPFNATRSQIIHHLFSHEAEELKASGNWGAALVIANDIMRDVSFALTKLDQYGIMLDDLLHLIVQRLDVGNPSALWEAILHNR